jgi:glycosyltransferase involved in cell wall biosynthesis
MKISIVTRAYNRLEYTVQCISSVHLNTIGIDYEHIIMNQASTDGTKEWLSWISDMPNRWYNRVKAVHCSTNYGDWGGMVRSRPFISLDSDYVVQLDNDILVPYDWARIMVEVMQKFPADVVMLKRRGVDIAIGPKRPFKTINVLENTRTVFCGRVKKATACWICSTKVFLSRVNQYHCCDVFTPGCGLIVKILDLPCIEIEGYNTLVEYPNRYVQHEKFFSSDRWGARKCLTRHFRDQQFRWIDIEKEIRNSLPKNFANPDRMVIGEFEKRMGPV